MAKLKMKWQWSRSPIGAVLAGVLALSLVGGCGAQSDPGRSDSVAEAAESLGQQSNPALFPPQSHPYGSDMVTWAENWWRWVLSIPSAENPFLSVTSDCSAGQSGRVFFAPPFPPGSKNLTRSCTVPHGKAVAFVLAAVPNDYAPRSASYYPTPAY